MKAKFLKLAGVKNEEEFYKKFPDEKSFMAKYGKQLKKAAPGISMPVNTNAFKLPTLTNTFASTPTPSFGSKVGAKAKSLASNVGKGVNEMIKPVDLSTPGGVAGIIGGIGAGINTIKQTKKNIAELEKYGKVSDVVLQATNIKPERVQNRYLRPEDNLVQNMNPLGTGTNYLAARNGAEIQNTYAPDVMYTDLGYEPLNDSNKMKQYKKGGKMKKAAGGAFLDIANSAADIAKQSGQLGGGLGSQIGGAGGETGGYTQMLGSLGGLGGLIGGLLDAPMLKKKQQAQSYLDKNTGLISGANDMNDFFQERDAFAKNGKKISSYEDGGWVSNDWQPQVIASFGEHNMEDLLAPDPMMDTLRAGGHLSYYTPPSERAMSTERAENGIQMAMGGDLQVHRGKAEPISYNPFLPNNGETVMFKGPSHDDGGMPISYGQNGVEVEGGEPAMVMKDGGTQDNLVVFGNMRIPDYGANEIGDKKSKGMKFKRYIADLSKKEAKNNKTMEKSLDLINSSNTDDPFDQLSFNSGQAMLTGSQMQLKDIADKKLSTAAVQNAILDTADEYGLDSAKLSDKQMAAFGGKFSMNEMFAKGGKKRKESLNKRYFPNTINTSNEVDTNLLLDPDTQRPYTSNEITDIRTMSQVIPDAFAKPATSKFTPPSSSPSGISDNDTTLQPIVQSVLSSIQPFIRPTAARPLDPNQLAPEYLSAAMNQQESVQAQLYNPMLTQATSISLQDQLNEVTAQSRAAERMAAYNPEAAAMIFSQVAQSKSKILADQFRMNQAEKQRVAEQNASVLNDAQLKNLSILDQQYVRQSQAKSNTKQQAIEVAKSIADKIAQNKLENRQQTVMENMYPDFNFTQDGRAYKNPFTVASFAPGMSRGSSQSDQLAQGYEDLYNKAGQRVSTRKTGKSDETVRNGAIVKAIKNL
jgi:hypothetical protein